MTHSRCEADQQLLQKEKPPAKQAAYLGSEPKQHGSIEPATEKGASGAYRPSNQTLSLNWPIPSSATPVLPM